MSLRPKKPWIEREWLITDQADDLGFGMERVEQDISLNLNNRRWNTQGHGAPTPQPGRSDQLEFWRRWNLCPGPWQSTDFQHLNGKISWYIESEKTQVSWSSERINVHKHLQGSERGRTRGVDDGLAPVVPTTRGVKPTKAIKGVGDIGLPTDPPDVHQLKMP